MPPPARLFIQTYDNAPGNLLRLLIPGGLEPSRVSDQSSVVIRGLWFLFFGWWASGLWTGIAYVATVTIVGIPLAVWMYDRLPFVVSLYRY